MASSHIETPDGWRRPVFFCARRTCHPALIDGPQISPKPLAGPKSLKLAS
jgi:hypothetical protein